MPYTPPKPLEAKPVEASRPAMTEAEHTRLSAREKAVREGRVRLTEDEIHEIGRKNLVDFLREKHGARIVATYPSYTTVALGDSKKPREIQVRDYGDRWGWIDKRGPDMGKGGIISLHAELSGMTNAVAMHDLRDHFATYTPDPTAATSRVEQMERDREAARKRAEAAKLDEDKPLSSRMADADRKKMVSVFTYAMVKGDRAWKWLSDERGIGRKLLDRFKNFIAPEAEGSRNNKGGAMFAHRDESLLITGIVKRGPEYRGNVGDSKRSLFQAGDVRDPKRIYITESTIDSLSVYQHDGEPPNALLLATDGSYNAEADRIIRLYAEKWPDAVWHVGQDNDPKLDEQTGRIVTKGHLWRDHIEAVIREAQPVAKIERRDPDDANGKRTYKDWNDRLRGPDHSKEAAEAREFILAGNRERDAKAEAERLRLEREAREAAEAANRPSGPRR